MLSSQVEKDYKPQGDWTLHRLVSATSFYAVSAIRRIKQSLWPQSTIHGTNFPATLVMGSVSQPSHKVGNEAPFTSVRRLLIVIVLIILPLKLMFASTRSYSYRFSLQS